MNSTAMTQLDIDRMFTRNQALDLMRQAQKILVDHLNHNYGDEPIMQPLRLLTDAVIQLKGAK